MNTVNRSNGLEGVCESGEECASLAHSVDPIPTPEKPPVKISREDKKEPVDIHRVLLLTIGQTAELLGYSRWAVQSLLRKGKMKFIPNGRIHKRISREEIDRWIRDSQVFNGPHPKRGV